VEQAERTKRNLAEIAVHEKQVADQELRARNLRQDLERLRGRIEQLRQDFERDIVAVRAASVGMVLGDLVLPSGVNLRECRIQRVEESGVLVGHALGVAQLAHQDLPQKIRERLRYGSEYLLADPQPVTASKTAEPPVAESPPEPPRMQPAAASSAPTKSEPSAAAEDGQTRKAQQRLIEGRLAVAQMKKELEALKEDLLKVDSELSFQNLSASRRYYAGQRKTTLEQQKSLMQRRLNAAEIELLRLESGGAP
jgi:molecular chaperone GrpE (heat shock protein)